VIAEAGRLGDAALIAIGDADAGIAVRLPAGSAAVARGAALIVDGTLAAPYGQLEIRPVAGGVVPDGTGTQPGPHAVDGALDESVEGRLAVVVGRIDGSPTAASSGDVSAVLVTDSGARLSIHADASSGIRRTDLVAGTRYRLTGIVGQRATALGRSDGYRIWLRDPADIAAAAGPTPRPSGTPSSSPAPTGSSLNPSPSPCPAASSCQPGQPIVSIAAAIVAGSGVVTIEGIVTTPPGLLDAARRETIIQDQSGAILVRLRTADAPPAQGHRLRVTGEVGRAYGAPRIAVQAIVDLGPDALPAVLVLKAPPNAAVEWRLVSLTGTIVAVHAASGGWTADVVMGQDRVEVQGLASAAIPAKLLIVGRSLTVVGIARRPYPTAKDRRFAIEPRSKSDLKVGTTAAAGSAPAAGPGAAGDPESRATSGSRTGSGGSATGPRSTGGELSGASGVNPRNATIDAPVDVDFSALRTRVGWNVRVGGLVVSVTGDQVAIDDGTTVGLVSVEGSAQVQLPSLRPGVAVNIVGKVRSDPVLAVVVSDPAGILPVGDATAVTAPSAPPALLAAVIAPPLGPLGPLGPGSDDLAAGERSADPAGEAGDGADSRPATGAAPRADLGGVALALLLIIGAGSVVARRRRIPTLRVAMAHRIGEGMAARAATRIGTAPTDVPATNGEARGR